MTVLLFCLGLLFFLVVLMISVILHEFGHYAVAKKFGLNVPKFSMGFGKPLFSFTRWGTKFSLAPIFLGGFVQIDDPNVEKPEVSDLEKRAEDETLTEEERKKSQKELKKRMESYKAQKGLLSYVTPWKRILIYLAGPAVNLVLGIGILYGVLMGFNTMVVNNIVETVNSCSTVSEIDSCEAEKAGILPGDKVVAVNGEKVRLTEDLSTHLRGIDEVNVTVVRDGKEIELTTGIKNGFLGVNLTPEIRPLTFVESTETMQNVFTQSLISISELPAKMPAVAEQTFTGGERDPEAPSSLVHAGKTYGDTSSDMELPAKTKIQLLLQYSGLLNISLAILNLVPFLVMLDGGKVAIAVVDQFKIWFARLFRKEYKPLGEFEITAMAMVSLVFIVGFMGMLMLSDVVNIIRGQI